MTTLYISTYWERDPWDIKTFGQVYKPPVSRIRVVLTLFGPNGHETVKYTWNLEARFYGNEERFRDELRRNSWWDFEVWSEGDADPRNITSVVVRDPEEILKWLINAQDLKDLFTEKIKLNDKPLRLPSANS